MPASSLAALRTQEPRTDFAVCYSLRLRLIEFADRPDILKQMASRALDDARGDDAGPKDEDERR